MPLSIRTRPILGAALLALVVNAAHAQSLRSYSNARFGTTAATPSDWKMQPPPGNDDGRVFMSPDGEASITISGILMISSFAQEVDERLQPAADESITYKVANRNVVVVSGFRGDRIFYRKSLLGCGVANDLAIEYPAAKKARYDALVGQVAASLRPGQGYQVSGC